jgi:hypothetical protein
VETTTSRPRRTTGRDVRERSFAHHQFFERMYGPQLKRVADVALRIGIHQQHLLSARRKAGGNVDGRGGLAYPALHIDHCDLAHGTASY